MRRVSLNARRQFDAQTSGETEVLLFYITHPSLDAPIRLSTDPSERLSAEPLAYGTRSSWMGSNKITEPFRFIVTSAELPSDLEDTPAAGRLVLENATNEVAEILQSFTDRPRIHLAVVLLSSPDVVEVEYRDLMIVSAEGDAGEATLTISRQPIEEESAQTIRFTKQRFPGLHR